jgi:hypothetical protein
VAGGSSVLAGGPAAGAGLLSAFDSEPSSCSCSCSCSVQRPSLSWL